MKQANIRAFRAEDEADVVSVWHRSGLRVYTFLPMFQALTPELATQVFREMILARCEIWVGTSDERVVAYLAMNGAYLDRLYVDPSEWRSGWGSRLIAQAKHLSPSGLTLHTHQENQGARRLYEKHGFEVVRFGVSPAPESAPDVEYAWRPQPQ